MFLERYLQHISEFPGLLVDTGKRVPKGAVGRHVMAYLSQLWSSWTSLPEGRPLLRKTKNSLNAAREILSLFSQNVLPRLLLAIEWTCISFHLSAS